jgi:hypothetical protein
MGHAASMHSLAMYLLSSSSSSASSTASHDDDSSVANDVDIEHRRRAVELLQRGANLGDGDCMLALALRLRYANTCWQ